MSYIQKDFKIISNKKLADGIFETVFECPELAEMAKAGQFLNIACGEKVLRRPISICRITDTTLTIVYQAKGEGTLWLSQRNEGELINILGPLGNGFDLSEKGKAVFIGGGIGVPPMLQSCLDYKGEKQVILGFRGADNVILSDAFDAEVQVATEDGSVGTKGYVTDILKDIIADIDVVFACGPIPMLKAIAKMAEDNNKLCFVSMEERMGCGIGACLSCACKVKKNGEEDYFHVCKHGPVFNATEVSFDG